MSNVNPVAPALHFAVGIIAGLLAASPAASATIAHQTDFSGDVSGFTTTGQWYAGGVGAVVGPFEIPQVGSPMPVFDHTPTDDNRLAGAGPLIRRDPFENVQTPKFLTSAAIDLGGWSDVTFSFWRFLNTDYLPYMSNTIDVFDGSGWVTLESGYAQGSEPRDADWTFKSFNVSTYANSDFRYRFGYHVLSPAILLVSGWHVDDVLIEGTAPTGAVPEPATWAMMIIGFGAAGSMIRRRRTLAA